MRRRERGQSPRGGWRGGGGEGRLEGPPRAKGSCGCGGGGRLMKVHLQLLQGRGIMLQLISPRVVAECGLEFSCHLRSPWPSGCPSLSHRPLPCQMGLVGHRRERLPGRAEHHTWHTLGAHSYMALPWARHLLVPHTSIVISMGQLETRPRDIK